MIFIFLIYQKTSIANDRLTGPRIYILFCSLPGARVNADANRAELTKLGFGSDPYSVFKGCDLSRR